MNKNVIDFRQIIADGIPLELSSEIMSEFCADKDSGDTFIHFTGSGYIKQVLLSIAPNKYDYMASLHCLYIMFSQTMRDALAANIDEEFLACYKVALNEEEFDGVLKLYSIKSRIIHEALSTFSAVESCGIELDHGRMVQISCSRALLAEAINFNFYIPVDYELLESGRHFYIKNLTPACFVFEIAEDEGFAMLNVHTKNNARLGQDSLRFLEHWAKENKISIPEYIHLSL